MKIYLASTAPGTERSTDTVLSLPRRLLSYYHIEQKKLDSHVVFQAIRDSGKKDPSNK